MSNFEIAAFDGENRYLVITPDTEATIYNTDTGLWSIPTSIASAITHVGHWESPDLIPQDVMDACADEFGYEITKVGVKGQSGDKAGHEFRGNQWWMIGPDGTPIRRPPKDKTDDGEASKPETAPAAPKAPRTRASKPSAEMVQKPVATYVKWGKGILPEGWTEQKRGANRIVYTSAKGNTAVLNVGSRGWRAGDYYTNTIMTIVDKWATGKKIDFTGARKVPSGTVAYVSSGDPQTIGIGNYGEVSADRIKDIGLYNPTIGIKDHDEVFAAMKDWKDLTAKAIQGKDKDAMDAVQKKLMEEDDRAVMPDARFANSWSTADTFLSTQRKMEADIVHELGHSQFYTNGDKISKIYDNLNKLLPKPFDWAAAQKADTKKFCQRFNPNTFADFGGGLTVKGSELYKYLTDNDFGIAPTSSAERDVLASLGATSYGQTKLQELVAESYAAYQLPNIPDTPITKAVADAYGWKKVQDYVQKSATMSSMSKPVGPTHGQNTYFDENGNKVEFFFTADTRHGPKDVLGDRVLGEPDTELIGND